MGIIVFAIMILVLVGCIIISGIGIYVCFMAGLIASGVMWIMTLLICILVLLLIVVTAE